MTVAAQRNAIRNFRLITCIKVFVSAMVATKLRSFSPCSVASHTFMPIPLLNCLFDEFEPLATNVGLVFSVFLVTLFGF